jgi:hypothetical protein
MSPEHIITEKALTCPKAHYTLIPADDCETCRFFISYSLSTKTRSISEFNDSQEKEKELEIICNYNDEKDLFLDEVEQVFSSWGYNSVETYSSEESFNLIGKNEYDYDITIARVLFKEIAGVGDVRKFIDDIGDANYETKILFALEKFTHYAKREAEAADIRVQVDTFRKPFSQSDEEYKNDIYDSNDENSYNDSDNGW